MEIDSIAAIRGVDNQSPVTNYHTVVAIHKSDLCQLSILKSTDRASLPVPGAATVIRAKNGTVRLSPLREIPDDPAMICIREKDPIKMPENGLALSFKGNSLPGSSTICGFYHGGSRIY